MVRVLTASCMQDLVVLCSSKGILHNAVEYAPVTGLVMYILGEGLILGGRTLTLIL